MGKGLIPADLDTWKPRRRGGHLPSFYAMHLQLVNMLFLSNRLNGLCFRCKVIHITHSLLSPICITRLVGATSTLSQYFSFSPRRLHAFALTRGLLRKMYFCAITFARCLGTGNRSHFSYKGEGLHAKYSRVPSPL